MRMDFQVVQKSYRVLGIGIALLFLAVLVSCTDVSSGGLVTSPVGTPSAPSTGGDLGATAGGVQDFKIARRLVERGQLPPLETLVTEGIFSEYDLPLTGPKCEKLLCLRGSLGYGPDEHSTESAWMQIGMSSGLDLATLERPSLSLVLVVDVSGSMSARYNTSQGSQVSLDVVKAMIGKIVPQLDEGDEVAIVTFGSQAKTELGFTAGNKHNQILNKINSLSPRGSTAMADGLKRGYALAKEGTGDETRVMLFSDENANVGDTGYMAFKEIADEANRSTNTDTIGLTLFGIGDGLRTDTYTLLSTTRGGNAFTLFDNTDVEQVMEESWPFMAYPLAYDLELRLLVPQKDFEFVEAYGFPADYASGNYTQKVNTVFLSQKRGATLVRFVPKDKNFDKLKISAVLSYEAARPSSLESETINLEISREEFDGQSKFFDQPSVEKTVILATFVEGIRHAIEAYIGYGSYYNEELATQHSPIIYPRPDRDKAIELMQGVVVDITQAAESYDEFLGEVTFANKVLELMKKKAEVPETYSYY